MMKTVFVSLFLISFSLISYSQKSPTEISKAFFEKYKQGDSDLAIDYIFTFSPYAEEIRDGIDDVKRSLKKLLLQYGKYYGFELLTQRFAGPNMTMLTYFVRHDREPLIINLLFYKPDNKWQLQNFKYSNPVEEELEEASKINRIRQNWE